jgi:hypothetical protein
MVQELVTFEMPQVLPGGFHMPARMTVLPLGAGEVALVSPIRLDDTLAARVDALGRVRLLIAPNLLHHLYLGDAAARWPEARVVAPRGLAKKRPDLRIDAAWEDGAPPELSGFVRAVPIEGAPTVDEVALYHEASRTLVLTDLVFHLRAPRGLVAHVALWLMGVHGKLAQSRAWRFFVRDRARAAASARALLELPFERLVVAHGEPVEADARPALTRALSWMLSWMPSHAQGEVATRALPSPERPARLER